MNRDVIHENATLLHHLLDVAQAQRVSHIPTHAGEHHLKRIVQPFEDLAQGAVDQSLPEIKHGPDCRLRLSQQNREGCYLILTQAGLDQFIAAHGKLAINVFASRQTQQPSSYRKSFFKAAKNSYSL